MQKWIRRSTFFSVRGLSVWGLLVCSLLVACNDSSSSSAASPVPPAGSGAPELTPENEQLAACTRDNPALTPPNAASGTAPEGYEADVSGDFALDLSLIHI